MDFRSLFKNSESILTVGSSIPGYTDFISGFLVTCNKVPFIYFFWNFLTIITSVESHTKYGTILVLQEFVSSLFLFTNQSAYSLYV